MKTEKEKNGEGIRILTEKRDNYFKTSCFGALVAKRGFTLMEIVTVIVIMSILIGFLLPAISQVKKIALETKQKAQLYSIEVGLESYKEDDSEIGGKYPPSHGYDDPLAPLGPNPPYDYDYCGAQTLAEAMFGRDLLGIPATSAYRADGMNANASLNLYPAFPDNANIKSRRGPFLDRTNIDVFRADEVFPGLTWEANMPKEKRYLICDVFATVIRKVGTEDQKIGTPILYFKANTSSANEILQNYATQTDHINNRYNRTDNYYLMRLGRVADGEKHPVTPSSDDSGEAFYNYIRDPLTIVRVPVRLDSYLLISAGYDGLYGTKDDICNFKPNL
ncbi:MAG: type II secretion system protein [Sedimentisphaerales bacterium]|nr:type II secretion system protein [Sedimentisphaerales bacterium]